MERIFSLDVVPWMILVFPLAGFVVLALLGERINRDREQFGATLLACVTVLLSFACALWTALHLGDLDAGLLRPAGLAGEHRPPPYAPFQPALSFDFLDVGGLRVPFALLLDQLSTVMMLVVTGIGSLIHIYSLGYMAHDPERVRFFSYLNLFTFFMLVLVTGNSLPLMFIGWEGVGLCSYLLIGFWYKKHSASDAGKKAFIVNRIGDAGLILGMALASTPSARSTCSSSRSTRATCPSRSGWSSVRRRSRRSCCSWAPAARARRSRCTSGCPTRWKGRRPSRP
jgi:NADH-quinone oxidoreductase subunit L